MRFRWLIAAGAVIVVASGTPRAAVAQDAKDPGAVMLEINAWYTEQLKQARDASKTPDFRALLDQRTEKIKAAAKEFDVAKVDAAKCLPLAQLYQQAGMHTETLAAAQKFLTSGPADQPKYTAQTMVISANNALGNLDEVARLVDEVKPPSPQAAAVFARTVAGVYAPAVARRKNPEAGIKLIDSAMSHVDLKAMREEDTKKAEEAEKTEDARQKQLLRSQSQQTDSLIATVFQSKATMLEAGGKSAEALAMLEEGLKQLPNGSTAGRQISAKLKQSKIVGSAALPIVKDRAFGEFESMESLKGKVVLVDFMAHWCGPCKASYPLTRKMYDELKGKGFEVVSVTRFYGYYGQERNLAPDAEFAKLKEHNDDHKINWPVVVGPGANSEQYGVTGIPTYVVIDRSGKVRAIKVGFSEAYFTELRKAVEAALAEPAAQSK